MQKSFKIVIALLYLSIIIVLTGGIFLSIISQVPIHSIAFLASFISADNTPDFLKQGKVTFVRQLLLISGLALVFSGALSMFLINKYKVVIHQFIRQVMVELVYGLEYLRKDYIGNKLEYLILLSIVIAGTFIRVHFLGEPMRYDESCSYLYYASPPFYVGMSDYSYPNNHILHTLLMHFSIEAFGNAPWALRLPCLLSGLVLIFASYGACRSLYGRHAAIICAALTSGSSILIEYAVNARGYSLMAFFFLVQVMGTSIMLRSKWRLPWVLFIIAGIAGFYTIPTMLYGFMIVFVWFLFSIIRNRSKSGAGTFLIIATSITAAGTIILYAPVILTTGWRSLVANQFVVPIASWSEFIARNSLYLTTTWAEWNRDIPLIMQLILTISFAVATIFHNKIGRQTLPILTGVLVLPFIVVLQKTAPYPRVWLFLLLLYLCTASAGIAWMLSQLTWVPHRHKRYLFFVCALGILALSASMILSGESISRSTQTVTLSDAAEVTRFLKTTLTEKDRVTAAPLSYPALLYYFSTNKVPRTFLSGIPSENGNLYVVSGTGAPAVPAILKNANLSLSLFTTPVLVRKFDRDASVYTMRVKNGGVHAE